MSAADWRRPQQLHPVVKPSILAAVAMKNLLAKPLRTALTIAAIVIGAGAIVFLMSLAIGLHSVVNRQVLGSKSVNTIDVTTPNNQVILLNTANLNKITQFAHIVAVAPSYILPGQISYHGSLSDTVVYGTTNQYLALSALNPLAGTGQLTASGDAIVNTSLLNLIGQSNAHQALGKKLAVQTTISSVDGSQKKQVTSNLTIVGVVNTGAGAEVYMQKQTLAAAGAPEYGQLKVEADNRADVSVIRQQIEGLGFTTASPLDTLDQINTIFTIFTFVVAGFGGIGMVIAVLGMFNTLTISLLERTKEIGLMITMGARKSDVQRLLIFEALILSAAGGFIGLLVAWLLGQAIDLALTHFANSHGVSGGIQAFEITPLLVAATIILTAIVGWLVAFYPSRRAARINPIDALRHE